MEIFLQGANMAIRAGAGSGKTATLEILARRAGARGLKGRYVAFNRAVVEDSRARMPDTVKCSTAHGLAYSQAGYRYKTRMEDSARMRSDEIASLLKLGSVSMDGKHIPADFLASHVIEALRRFCQSADDHPTTRHFSYVDGLDVADAKGRRSYVNNNILSDHLLPFLEKAWADAKSAKGKLPFDHSFYLKVAQLEGVTLKADFLMVDEAQDLSPVLLDIVEQQELQVVLVGDPGQAIYAFTGAIDAFKKLKDDVILTTLTQSFRFGDDIASLANTILAKLDGFVLRGNPLRDSRVTVVPKPAAILCRTNGMAVSRMIDEVAEGRKAHLVGGGVDVVSFVRAAGQLRGGKKVTHKDLACFETWDAVRDYVNNDAQGKDLKTLVTLVDRHGAGQIISLLTNQPHESAAQVVVSTAHKAKGREWDSVKLADDFDPVNEEGGLIDEEMRLLYVAVTRAKLSLDVVDVDHLSRYTSEVDNTDA